MLTHYRPNLHVVRISAPQALAMAPEDPSVARPALQDSLMPKLVTPCLTPTLTPQSKMPQPTATQPWLASPTTAAAETLIRQSNFSKGCMGWSCHLCGFQSGSVRRAGVFGFGIYLHCYLGHLIQQNVEDLYLEGLPILGLLSIRQTRPVSRPFIYVEFCGLLGIMGFTR
jgi:hypothetical protein